ncbi:MAG TPA: nickel transporter [Zoogloea sp.]|uniref:HoxN/HupN/NixA family nickel/cobalt transporter n=1 Tax=Zoogloea sp. TaxID=49181 RepID=UPI002B6D263C|nr:nickel transporter [Zoogloea sp.]HMV19061.1 nickel transporter [Rhodocyclaceae bacterium]HMV64617.1 nickel transporter [Rhodocyclaceae bacterium]HMW53376.1 nickel transporter [Rhodocyclaceae bacterium]HMZ77369.1 nickel transporter [Rhodocyclaceae bacterium]HNA69210.1 nickel transporter [Rhodocyclaceae bacterium]
MESLPLDSPSLVALVFLLGLKHGFDADHLATIDGLTRFNARSRPRLARLCGTLFSLGHGAVVLAVAVGASLLSRGWQAPEWLELSGAGISILFLLGLGVLNLGAVLAAPRDAVVRPLGLKGRWLGRLAEVSHPAGVALVGALFALSFDTLSQAALFAVAGGSGAGGGALRAAGLAGCFVLGMLVADGANGFWIARLIARADGVARIASRVMALAVAGMSLLVAAYGLARLLSPRIEAWGEGKELLLGAVVVTVMAASFVVGLRLARIQGAPAAARG